MAEPANAPDIEDHAVTYAVVPDLERDHVGIELLFVDERAPNNRALVALGLPREEAEQFAYKILDAVTHLEEARTQAARGKEQ